jgi:hypothetical protein
MMARHSKNTLLRGGALAVAASLIKACEGTGSGNGPSTPDFFDPHYYQEGYIPPESGSIQPPPRPAHPIVRPAPVRPMPVRR